MGLLDDADHELAIIGEQNGGRTDYYVEATGPVYDEQLNGHDKIDEKSVRGHVNGGIDRLGYDGTLKGIAFPPKGPVGDYRLERDGQRVWPYQINMRTVRAETSADNAPYMFAVIGDVIGGKHTTGEDAIWPIVEGQHGGVYLVSGRVKSGGLDEWYVSGWCSWPASNQELTASIDGREMSYPGNKPLGVVDY